MKEKSWGSLGNLSKMLLCILRGVRVSILKVCVAILAWLINLEELSDKHVSCT